MTFRFINTCYSWIKYAANSIVAPEVTALSKRYTRDRRFTVERTGTIFQRIFIQPRDQTDLAATNHLWQQASFLARTIYKMKQPEGRITRLMVSNFLLVDPGVSITVQNSNGEERSYRTTRQSPQLLVTSPHSDDASTA